MIYAFSRMFCFITDCCFFVDLNRIITQLIDKLNKIKSPLLNYSPLPAQDCEVFISQYRTFYPISYPTTFVFCSVKMCRRINMQILDWETKLRYSLMSCLRKESFNIFCNISSGKFFQAQCIWLSKRILLKKQIIMNF